MLELHPRRRRQLEPALALVRWEVEQEQRIGADGTPRHFPACYLYHMKKEPRKTKQNRIESKDYEFLSRPRVDEGAQIYSTIVSDIKNHISPEWSGVYPGR